MQELIITAVVSLVLFMDFLYASPYDHCSQVLAEGVYDNYIDTNNSYEESLLKKWACSVDAGSEANSIAFNLIISGIGGGISFGDAESWRQENCSSNEMQRSTGDYSHQLIQVVNNNIVDAWTMCVQGQTNGLSCFAKQSPSSLTFIIHWNPKPGIPRTLDLEFGLRNLQSTTSTPEILIPGEDILDLVIEDTTQEAKILLRATNEEDFRTSCSYLIIDSEEMANDNPQDPPPDIIRGPFPETLRWEDNIGKLYIQVHAQTSGVSNSPSTELSVPENFKIIGGGARVNFSFPGNLLTASFPSSERTWFASATEQGLASKASITAFAVAARMIDGSSIPDNAYELMLSESDKENIPKALTVMMPGFLLTGGGARVENSHPQFRTLLYASLPLENAWFAAAKEHESENPTKIISYAIGLKESFLQSKARINLYAKNQTSIYEEKSPQGHCTIDKGDVLISGGAHAHWKDAGLLLTASFPQSYSKWATKAKSHYRYERNLITTWCIGLKKKD